MPGRVMKYAQHGVSRGWPSGLSRDSVINVTALVTVDRSDLDPPVGRLPGDLLEQLDAGLRLVLAL